MDTVAPM